MLVLQKEKKQSSRCELISFDIFDTLVTRRVATPAGIFAIMQNILMQDTSFTPDFKNNFCKIRVNSENLARISAKQSNNYCEISFDEIYNLIQQKFNLSDYQTKFLKKLEIETEIKNLVPINKNIALLKDYLSQGSRVVLISDMYHSAETIRKMLLCIDDVFKDLKIYVSNEYRVSKGEGGLYSRIQELENTNFCNWSHCGDNKHADIKIAKKYGIQTKFFPLPALKPYEKILLTKHPENLDYQIITGCARLARLQNTSINPGKYDFGASFAGPILYSFVNFVIEQTLSHGIKTLYFIARDGFIPKIIADIIIKNKGLNIKTKYLYGSRKAWRLPAEKNYDDIINWCLREYKNRISYNFISYQLGVSQENLRALTRLNIPFDKIFSKSQRKKLEKILKNSPDIKKLIINTNLPQIELLKKYVKQEIELNPAENAFVDLCGSGRSLDELFKLTGIQEKFSCFYFVKVNSNYELNLNIIPYLDEFSECHWIELLSKSFDGQTVGYVEKDNRIKAVTEINNGNLMRQWGLEEYIQGIKDFTQNISDITKINDIREVDFKSAADEYINYARDLDKETADILGSIPHKLTGDESICSCVAPEISFWKSFIGFIFCRKNFGTSEYPFISIAKSTGLKKVWLNFQQKYPTLQKFLLNIHINRKNKESRITILGIKIPLAKLLRRKN